MKGMAHPCHVLDNVAKFGYRRRQNQTRRQARMGSFESIIMIVALLLMAGAVAAKMVTTYLIKRTKMHIAMVDQTKQKILGELKMAQSQRKVAEQNKTTLTQKKTKIQQQISRLTKELNVMEEERAQEQKKREAMRRSLTE